MIYDLPNPFMDVSLGTLLRQPKVIDSRDVAAEWGSFPLDADGDTKRLSTQGADGQAGGSGAPTFMQVSDAGIPVSDREAAALEPDEPAPTCGGVAAEPVGYQCCHDCGVREPCDRHCPYEQAMERYRARLNRARGGDSRFELDPATFMSDIEPVPAFLTQPIMNETELMNVALDHLHYGADSRALEIEELLELARAKDWPAPPRRMAG